MNRLNPHSELGAVIPDVYLRNLDPQWIQDQLNTYSVLVFPDQHLTPHSQLEFAHSLGEVHENPYLPAVDSDPRISLLHTEPDHARVIGTTWHSDHSYTTEPPQYTVLSAVQVPPTGGDTQFASTRVDSRFSTDFLKTLAGLRAHHSTGNHSVYHPVITEHPNTQAQVIYVNPGFVSHFENSTAAASKPMLDSIYETITKPEYTTTVKWQPGMTVIWDNAQVLHCATADYPGHTRTMYRTMTGRWRP